MGLGAGKLPQPAAQSLLASPPPPPPPPLPSKATKEALEMQEDGATKRGIEGAPRG